MKIEVSTGRPPGGAASADEPERWVEKSEKTRESAVSYRETPTALELKMDMPEAEPGGLDVVLRGRKLTVTHEKKSEQRSDEGGRRRVETRTESLKREVDLPCDVDPGRVDAVLRGGVLRVTLAKAK